jgi:uncharacterized membrane protein YqjE
MTSDGWEPQSEADKTLGDVVADVSTKASQLVREEIELAKAEVKDKVSKLTKGAGIAAAAGVFLVFGVTLLLHTVAWLINDAFNFSGAWPGFAIVTGALFILAAVAGLLAVRFFKKGSPPTPEMAIEQAKLTREELEHQSIERDQVPRTLEKGSA